MVRPGVTMQRPKAYRIVWCVREALWQAILKTPSATERIWS